MPRYYHSYFLRAAVPRNAEARDALLRILRDTDQMVRVAVAYLTDRRLAAELVARAERGAPTRVILNNSDIIRPLTEKSSLLAISRAMLDVMSAATEGSALQVKALGKRLRLSATDYRSKGGSVVHLTENMHHKFLVSRNVVAFGSLNWTNAGITNNYESLVITNNRDLIFQFREEFSELWKEASWIEVVGKHVWSIQCPECDGEDCVDLQSRGPYCLYCNHEFRIEEE